jgi:hypothetical protein
MSYKHLPVSILIAVLLLPAVCRATTVQRLELDDLVEKSSAIVMGRVSAARTFWTGNGRLILTTYTLDVAETLKGRASRRVELTTIGGTIGTVSLHVSGMPVFQQGETAIVFVETSGAFSTIVGLAQGKFSVTNGEVSNTTAGLSFPDGLPGARLKMPVAEFKNRIKSLLNR